MTIEEALVDKLTAVSAITSLLADGANSIYPQLMPESAGYPCITFQRISGTRAPVLAGSSGVANPRIQIDCWGKTYGASKALAEQVRLGIADISGETWGTVEVGEVTLISDQDLYEEPDELYRVLMDFSIWHQESRAVTI